MVGVSAAVSAVASVGEFGRARWEEVPFSPEKENSLFETV
jgi:hypothetical protein